MRSMQNDPATPDDPRLGLYDAAPVPDADLWFLPDDHTLDGPNGISPLGPHAAQRQLVDPREWLAAQGRLSGELADLAARFGALDERLRAGPEGWRQRLALLEVADLGWWTGARTSVERLALWVGLRVGATGDDAQAVARAGWAVRRLTAGLGPGNSAQSLAAFLGRTALDAGAIPEAVADLADIMETTHALHPVTQAAVMFHSWRMLGQGAALLQPSQDMEAAVIAARHAAVMVQGGGSGRRTTLPGRGEGAMFLPLALSGPTALRATGTPEAKLAAWIGGATQAVLAALLHLDRIGDWHDRAAATISDLTGRTPPAILALLTAWPMVSAPMAEERTGASRAAVQRNLDMFADRGLIREVTGQGRYRVWTARI